MFFDRTPTTATSQGPPLAERITDDPVITKTTQSTVTLAYQANIAGYWQNVTVVWLKNLMNHSLCITVDSRDGDFHYTCKVDLKPWHFWSKKGYKSFEVESRRKVDVYWDLRSAKFPSGSPEPCADFYVALVSDEEVVLLLGDYKKKAYKRTKSRPALVEAVLFYKKENVFGKRSFSTRARLDEMAKKEHEITVEGSTSGPRDPEMWVSVDGIVVVHVRNLHWKFRGNQTVMVGKTQVHVYWDVHDWLFKSPPGSGHGLFIFKPEPADSQSDREGSGRGGGENSQNSAGSSYYPAQSGFPNPEFCLFLYAWKVD
ncbi:hypothetical protein SAY86_014735 [Trapa natans]|uniref:Uncharacterized protein n=1 Tax=Trapa natans TaxID=22666 RepID=A0AAN7QGJ3_TRANT|nr:hypothetical protein SAY86_014735 [Trapa natans]